MKNLDNKIEIQNQNRAESAGTTQQPLQQLLLDKNTCHQDSILCSGEIEYFIKIGVPRCQRIEDVRRTR